jgi:hypothetical protein
MYWTAGSVASRSVRALRVGDYPPCDRHNHACRVGFQRDRARARDFDRFGRHGHLLLKTTRSTLRLILAAWGLIWGLEPVDFGG